MTSATPVGGRCARLSWCVVPCLQVAGGPVLINTPAPSPLASGILHDSAPEPLRRVLGARGSSVNKVKERQMPFSRLPCSTLPVLRASGMPHGTEWRVTCGPRRQVTLHGTARELVLFEIFFCVYARVWPGRAAPTLAPDAAGSWYQSHHSDPHMPLQGQYGAAGPGPRVQVQVQVQV